MAERILVIDDEVYACRLLEMILERHGYEVVAVRSAAEGLKRLQDTRFDAITLDLMMPGMNGLQFLQHIQSEPAFKDIPVVLITAAGTEEEIEQARSIGAVGAIIKPFSERQLMQLVQQALQKGKQ